MAVLAIAVTTGLASIATFLVKGPQALAAAAWWMLGLLLLAGLAALTLYRMAANRPALRNAGIREDHVLRIVVAHRGARMLGGAAFFIAGILSTPQLLGAGQRTYGEGLYPELEPSGFQITCLMLGAVLCITARGHGLPLPRTQRQRPEREPTLSALVTVDLRDATPPFEQIRTQIASLIAVGRLADGSRLPTVRALASDLGVATGTVARAYKELEAAGLIESRRRLGTVVTHAQAGDGGTKAAHGIELRISELIAEARTAGLDDETLLALVRGRLRATD